MGRTKKESFFWASYADLMTSLFFVMLVLFILAIALLHKKVVATEEQLNKIVEIEKATQNIDSTYFEYRAQYKKHILKISVQFPTAQSDFSFIDNTTKNELEAAGKAIKKFVQKNSKFNVQYLLIIEGQASKDQYAKNSELSYARALALKKFWDAKAIDFGENCEVLISGSGTGGTMREPSEALNQRFLIHIVPKPGIIEAKKEHEK